MLFIFSTGIAYAEDKMLLSQLSIDISEVIDKDIFTFRCKCIPPVDIYQQMEKRQLEDFYKSYIGYKHCVLLCYEELFENGEVINKLIDDKRIQKIPGAKERLISVKKKIDINAVTLMDKYNLLNYLVEKKLGETDSAESIPQFTQEADSHVLELRLDKIKKCYANFFNGVLLRKNKNIQLDNKLDEIDR